MIQKFPRLFHASASLQPVSKLYFGACKSYNSDPSSVSPPKGSRRKIRVNVRAESRQLAGLSRFVIWTPGLCDWQPATVGDLPPLKAAEQDRAIPKRVRYQSPFLITKTFVLINKVGIRHPTNRHLYVRTRHQHRSTSVAVSSPVVSVSPHFVQPRTQSRSTAISNTLDIQTTHLQQSHASELIRLSTVLHHLRERLQHLTQAHVQLSRS